MAARRPRLEAAFEVLGGDAFVAKPGGDAFAELGAALSTDNDVSAGEVAGPGGDRSEVAPDRSRDQAGIGGEILIVANVYDRRRAGKADETCELGSIDLRMRRHARPFFLRRKVT
jgi:hypothetical protein